jgi:hypothetical protein
MNARFSLSLVATLAASLGAALPALAWAPKRAPIMTRFAAQVNPQNPLPEYPRPQLVRSQWQNLNGIWQYQPGVEGDAVPTGRTLASEICVPYPVESALSGVMEHHDRLWYRRTFSVPKAWKGQQLKLNFGAVDYEAQVFVNGKSVGVHRGGYESFSYDIAPYLKGDGPQELIVRVFDPTDLGGQPRGKQTLNPGGIMYTPTTGIWQTVWLEPVAKTSIQNLHMVPDIDAKTIRLTINAPGASAQSQAVVSIKDGGKVIKTVSVAPNVEVAIPIANPKLWSPDSPFLYDVDVSLQDNRGGTKRSPLDRVTSYFGMRKISVGQVNGVPKMLLNNRFVFELGPLDQGFWPDGIYTPPTESALVADVQSMKTLGFNMVRKHIKVEPARWYYQTDKLGLLVWQDMPSPNSYTDHPQPLDKGAYDQQLSSVITSHWNSPSIIMWVVFNEGQGRHDTARIADMAKTLDPSRLVNRDSGAGYDKDDNEGTVGDVDDVHSYPPPNFPPPSPNQALACGEYGGIGFLIKGHAWRDTGGGYTNVTDKTTLEETYGQYAALLKSFRDDHGLSAAVYTQLTDVETEVNGLFTYDRVLKCDPKEIALANRFQYLVPTYRSIVPTSETTGQTWKYSFDKPADNWTSISFDDNTWRTGQGGFGTEGTPGIGKLGTTWNTPDIWLRRTFFPGTLNAAQLAQLVLRDYHDEDVEVYINGVLAYGATGFTGSYENKPLSDAAKAALVMGGANTIAVHCHQTAGGQFVDVGLSQKIPAAR